MFKGIKRHLISVFGTNWERGGGSETQVIQPTAPDVQESSEQLYKSRLKYDPLIAQQTQDIQQQMLPQQTALQQALLQQYYPQLAQLYTTTQAQQAPQLQAMMEGMQPEAAAATRAGGQLAVQGLTAPVSGQLQQAGLEQALAGIQQPYTPLQQAMATQAQTQLTPTGLSPEQEAAQEAIRAREIDRLQRLMRGRAQLGGQLFGGRPEEMERLATEEMGQAFAAEDIDRQEQQRQMAIQQALGVGGLQQQTRQQGLASAFAAQQQMQQQAQPFINILYPQAAQAGQVQTSPFQFQGVTPSADTYYSALANLAGQQAVVPGQPSPLFGALGAIGGGLGSAYTGNIGPFKFGG